MTSVTKFQSCKTAKRQSYQEISVDARKGLHIGQCYFQRQEQLQN